MYDTVIFDLDGTLLYTLEDLADSVNHVLANHGYPVHSYEKIRTFIGSGAKNLITMSLPENTDKKTIEQCLNEYKVYYTSHSKIKTRPYEGILDMLKEFKNADIKMAIVSNKNAEAVKELHKYYFEETIHIAVGEGNGIKRKPDPSSILAAAKQLKAERVLYVGDSLNDSLASKNAGVDCCLVRWGFGFDLDSLEAEYLVSTVDELKKTVLG